MEEYIKNQLQQGRTHEEIAVALKSVGHLRGNIRRGFATVLNKGRGKEQRIIAAVSLCIWVVALVLPALYIGPEGATWDWGTGEYVYGYEAFSTGLFFLLFFGILIANPIYFIAFVANFIWIYRIVPMLFKGRGIRPFKSQLVMSVFAIVMSCFVLIPHEGANGSTGGQTILYFIPSIGAIVWIVAVALPNIYMLYVRNKNK
jgi:hypothetical protein